MSSEPRDIWKDGPDRAAIYPYAVRCDRQRNAAIERAARAAGLSPTSFVQQQFDRMVDGIMPDAKAVEKAERAADPSRAEADDAKASGLTVGELRVYRAVAAAADETGRAEIGAGTLARLTGYTDNSVRVMLTHLVSKDRLRRISNAGWRRTTVYQVKPLEPTP